MLNIKKNIQYNKYVNNYAYISLLIAKNYVINYHRFFEVTLPQLYVYFPILKIIEMPEKVIEHVGIAPDSAEHIALLGIVKQSNIWINNFVNLNKKFGFKESKLKKLQKNNPSKISGKDIITSMCRFRDIYMQDYMANGSNTNDSGAIIVESIDTSYLEVLKILILKLNYYIELNMLTF